MPDFDDWMRLINAGPSTDDMSPAALDETVVDQVVASLRIDGCEADPAVLRNILAHGRLDTMTREQVLASVAGQVASSQRLAGVETTPEQVLNILNQQE